MIKNYLHYAVAAAFLLASGTGNLAFAEVEVEPPSNDSISTAQRLVIGPSGKVQVTGSIGVLTKMMMPVVPDIDFYSFHGRAGDVVTIDIDGGIKDRTSDLRSLDTLIAIFGPGLFDQNDDAPLPVDEGSRNRFDARLDKVRLPANGVYTVGVTSAGVVGSTPRVFLPDGTATAFVPNPGSNGGYTLNIEGVTPTMKQISIDIKPGADRIASINPKAKGKIPVALLSSADFNALLADRSSIKFGPTGTEASAAHCGKGGEYVNDDDLLDLVCHFENDEANFQESDTRGVVQGTIDGLPFEGRGWLKVIPVKRQD